MRSRRHRAIYWAKVGRKTKVKWHVPNLDDVIFLKPLSEDSVFFEKEQLVINEPKPHPIEDFKNSMLRLGERLWRLRNANNNKK